MQNTQTTWLAERVYSGREWQTGKKLTCDSAGQLISSSTPAAGVIELSQRALLPGLVNTHSHAFQRVIRGLTEYRTPASTDSFWTWREIMYSAANRLTPEDIYDASRMAFLEMALSGITTVGEFHYLHHNSDGRPYDDPNLLAKAVVRAARDVGLRIVLLSVAYARSGFETDPNPQQKRFLETDPENFLRTFETLSSELRSDSAVKTGLAPHSVRALPLSYLKALSDFALTRKLPIHMHAAEQPAEVAACIAEHGRSPLALLETEGLLSEYFTAVHAIHVSEGEARALAASRAMVCACPTTERNLGDGVFPAALYFREQVPVSLGSDSQIQIDLLEDARELEYGMRLQQMQRAALSSEHDEQRAALATSLFDCATRNGARSLGTGTGELLTGNAADFFTVDLNDVSIAGAETEDLLTAIVFSLSRTAVKDVVVGGKQIVSEGHHANQDEIVDRFVRLQKNLWGAL